MQQQCATLHLSQFFFVGDWEQRDRTKLCNFVSISEGAYAYSSHMIDRLHLPLA